MAAEDGIYNRLDIKSRDGQFLWELQNGFELSPRESLLILETVQIYYSQTPEADGSRVSLWVVSRDSSVGKPLESLPKVQVWVSVDGGKEDIEAYEKWGQIGLRRQKLLRINEEIVDQYGLPTQEDLARVLGTSVRTIRRDIAYLKDQGIRVITRGFYSDIGPGVSHKAMIVQMFLEGSVYTDICRRLRHSSKSVKRYVNSFSRVVSLYKRGIETAGEIAHYVGISKRLAGEYLELYFSVKDNTLYAARIEDMMRQLSSRADYEGADPSGMKKKTREVGI
jgi:hypothetical protein